MEQDVDRSGSEPSPEHELREQRREFLKKSMQVAYATPLVVSMLVERANAANSWNPGKGKVPDNRGGNPFGSVPPARP